MTLAEQIEKLLKEYQGVELHIATEQGFKDLAALLAEKLCVDQHKIKDILIDLAFKRSTTEFVLPDADVFATAIASADIIKVKE